MRRKKWSTLAVGLALPVLLVACGGTKHEAGTDPASVESVVGTKLSRITLTPQAAQRLDVQTAPVRTAASGTTQTVVPYSAVLYSPTGETWVYVSIKPLTFVRRHIVVERIDGNRAVLSAGPPPGTQVVTVAVAELYGTESGLGAH